MPALTGPRAAAALMVAAGLLAGCTADVVDGRGSAAAPAGGPTGFPSAPASTGSSEPVAAGVLVIDRVGRFQVRMPGRPTRTTQPGSFGGYDFTVRIAAVHEPYLALVEGEHISPALPQDGYDSLLRAAIGGFAGTSGMDLVSQSDTTFQGHVAREAILDRDGTHFKFLVVVYSSTQTYSLLAPEGAQFDALAGSFQAI